MVLLGQIMMARRKKGMYTAFIDFKKAYDRVNGSKLWDFLEGIGMGGRWGCRMVEFLKVAYTESRCEV